MRRNSCSPSRRRFRRCCGRWSRRSWHRCPGAAVVQALASRRPIVDFPEPGMPDQHRFRGHQPDARCAAACGRFARCDDRSQVAVDVAAGLGQRVAAELLQRRAASTSATMASATTPPRAPRRHRTLVDRDRLLAGGHVDGGQRARHRRDRLHRRPHPHRLAVGHPALEAAGPVRRAHHAVGAGIHLVVRDAAAAARGLEAVADLDALDRLDAHQRAGQPAVEAVVAAGERAEPDGRP